MLEMDVKLTLDRYDLTATLALDSPLTALFGPSGAGKSTLLGMIAGTVQPRSGWIKLGGETLFDARRGIRVPPGRRRVGLVGGRTTVHPGRPLRTQLQDAREQAPSRGDGYAIDEIIHLLGLEHLLDSPPERWSADETRRVAVARALMASPRLLLLDDHSDPSLPASTAQVLPYLSRIQQALKLPILYVGRSLGEILPLTDQMVLIANGRVLGVGDVHDIIADKLLLASSALHGIENILPVTIVDHDVEDGCTLANYYGTGLVLPIAPQLTQNASARIAIRSSDIALSKRYLDGTSIQNQIKGRICAIIRTPEHAVVQIDCGNTLLAGISLRALNAMNLREGDTVYCLMKAHAFCYVTDTVTASASRIPAPDAPTH